MSYYGMVVGVTILLICAFINYFTFMTLNKAVEMSKRKSYPNVCSYYFGNTYAKLTSFILLIVNYSSCIVYPTVGKKFKN